LRAEGFDSPKLYINYEIKKPDYWQFDWDDDELLGYNEEL